MRHMSLYLSIHQLYRKTIISTSNYSTIHCSSGRHISAALLLNGMSGASHVSTIVSGILFFLRLVLYWLQIVMVYYN